ncbi:MAG: caspase family protein [Candidatus Melainabacteria bacterium]|nr:MAG: caspase family protein [Candidatus Melainabacteria bacterium]
MTKKWKQLGITLLLSICVTVGNACTSRVFAQGQDQDLNKPVRDKWALIVGISKFKNSNVPSLKFASKDALDFYNYLIKEGNFKPDHVRVLLDEQATRQRIMSELGNKFLHPLAKKDDLVVLYFSTHGSPAQLDGEGKNFLVAYDSEPDELWASGIEMQQILENVNSRIHADRALLVLDACHSGNINPNTKDGKGLYRAANIDPNAMTLGTGKMVLCSSSPEEASWESKRYQNGVFTRNLLEGLRAKGANTPMSDAFDVMCSNISNEVQEDRPGVRQTPALNSKWQGNGMILAVRPAAPQLIPQTVSDLLPPDSIAIMRGGKSGVGGQNNNVAFATRLSNAPSDQKTNLASPQKLVLTWKYFSNVENPDKAYTSACEAGDANFNNVEFLFNKAKINIQRQKWSAAEQQLKNALIDDPNRWDFYLARAYCYYKMKRNALAMSDLENAKFKNPTLPRDIEFGD